MTDKSTHFETACVHAGTELNESSHGVNTPIYPSSAFQFRGVDNVYPRYYNTINQQVLEQKLSALEGAEAALLFSSGMAAITTSLLHFLQTGDHAIFSNQLYGGTYNLILKEFPKRGITFSFVEGNDVQAIENAINENTKVLYIETPSNPLLSIIDIEEAAKVAKKHNLISMIDNTFASPVNQNPFKLGIDIVLHSGTKYLGGHSDLCFGTAITSEALRKEIYSTAVNYGGSLNAMDCYLIERSLKTLSVRVEKQNENALKIAQVLSEMPEIKKVNYPGLESHPDHHIAKKQMYGFGGMLSFELAVESSAEVNQFLDHLNLIQPALSLGGVESIICVPAETSHIKMPKEERAAAGISDGLLRLSIGIENADDLIEEIKNAVMKVSLIETLA